MKPRVHLFFNWILYPKRRLIYPNCICTTYLYIRNKDSYQRCLPGLSVLRYKDKIEFKSFFVLVVLDFIAWFNRLALWKFGNKWPIVFHVWQIFWGLKKSQKHDEFLRLLLPCSWKSQSNILGWSGKEGSVQKVMTNAC